MTTKNSTYSLIRFYAHVCRFFSFAIFLLVFSTAFSQNFDQKTLSIYFPSNGDELSSEAKSSIRKAIMEVYPNIIREIRLEGHTDSDASTSYNVSLSYRRVESTRAYLLTQGVKPNLIEFGAFGESQPISTKKAKNRRVSVTIIYQTEDEPKNLILKSGEAKYVKITVFDDLTKNPLPCTYVLERNGKNLFANTNVKGVCFFDRKHHPELNLTFSKNGFLNATVVVDDRMVQNTGDTLFIEVNLKKVNVVQKLRFDHIYFYTDTDEFKPEAKQELEKLLKMLEEESELYIEIQGHMNFSKNRQANLFQKIYNHDLSHRRAKAVFEYLIKNGIDKERLTYKGLSNFHMIYPYPANSTEADQNKRVEVWTMQLADNAN